jgi:(2S)-methylsuccinyl-CoA dehydrogenase
VTALAHAHTLIDAVADALATASRHLAAACTVDGRIDAARLDEHQATAYDLASLSSALVAARALSELGAPEGLQSRLALVAAADVAADLLARVAGREADFGLERDPLAGVADALAAGRDTTLLGEVGDEVLATG